MTRIFYNGTYSKEHALARYLRMSGEKTDVVLPENEADARSIGTEFLRFYGRTLDLALTYTDGCVPAGVLNGALAFKIADSFGKVGQAIGEDRMSDALTLLEGMGGEANDWLDHELFNPTDFNQIIYNAVQISVNLALMYEPFLPRTAANLRRNLGFGSSWQFSSIPSGSKLAFPRS